MFTKLKNVAILAYASYSIYCWLQFVEENGNEFHKLVEEWKSDS